MNLVRWKFENIDVPMMELDDGTLCTTGYVVASALGVTQNNLQHIYNNRQEDFKGLRLRENWGNTVPPIDFLRQNREEFGLTYIRDNMYLWTESDMIMFAILSRSEKSFDFRQGLIEFVKQNARKNYVTVEEYQMLLGHYSQVQQHLQILEQNQANMQRQLEAIAKANPILELAASAAGSMLAAQKGMKKLRDN